MRHELGLSLPESYSGHNSSEKASDSIDAHPREEVLIRDILNRSITRRDFNKGLVKGAALVAAMTVPGLVLHEPPKPEHEMDRASIIERLKTYSYRLYAHNSADNDTSLERALRSTIPNVEIDVQWHKNKLYVAHESKDLKHLNAGQLAKRELNYVVGEVVAAGKNPAFDLKLEKEDEEGFEAFQFAVDQLVPGDRLTTFSGTNFSFLDHIQGSANRIVTYTLDPGRYSVYKGAFDQRYEQWQQEGVDITGRGMAVRMDYATPELLEENRQKGLETNVWRVNNEMKALQVLQSGATGITSDNTQMLEAMVLAG